MITTGSRVFYLMAFVTFQAAVIYSLATGGEFIFFIVPAALAGGYLGGVGDQTGYGVLLGLSVVLFVLGLIMSMTRDSDPRAQMEAAGTGELPEARSPGVVSYWPIIAAFAAGAVMVGLVFETALAWVGVAVGVVTVLAWSLDAWAAGATADRATNQAIRARVVGPVEVPILVAFGMLLFVASVSRVLLTVPGTGASVIAIVVSSIILAIAFVLGYNPQLLRSIGPMVFVIGAVIVLVGGVVGGVIGEGDIEPHHEEHEETEEPANGDHEEEGAMVVVLR